MRIDVEEIWSGFMGFPFLAGFWTEGINRNVGWTTDKNISDLAKELPADRIAISCLNDEKRIRSAAIRVTPK